MDLTIYLLILIIIGILLILGIAGLFFLLLTRKQEKPPESLIMLQKQLETLRESVDTKLSESTKVIQSQFNQSAKIIQNVTEKLTKLDETNKQVMGFAEQLQSLENILKNPKQRGILGEYYLEELLKNVFNPNQYQMQYQFEDGQIVDAVIFIGEDKIIPIDSKFSLENYNRIIKEKDPQKRKELEKQFRRDLKTRIKETAKYIRPNEGTFEFAFMFIPAEAVFYDLLVNKVGAIKSSTRDLIEYAVREKRVIPVSPTSFYAYLQTILQGLRAMQIEKSAKEIRKGIESLGRHLANYDEYLKKLGNSLSVTVSNYNKTYKAFGKIDKDVKKITKGESKIEVKKLKKPEKE